MKRSEINAILQSAQDFFDAHQFRLPRWAALSPRCYWIQLCCPLSWAVSFC